MKDEHIYFWDDEFDNKGTTQDTSGQELQQEQTQDTDK